jgi:hypothetical protein
MGLLKRNSTFMHSPVHREDSFWAGQYLKENDMNPCRKCGKSEPEVKFGSYPSGTRKPDCNVCVAIYQRAWQKDGGAVNPQPDYVPDCMGVRHPDEAVMALNVWFMTKEYEDRERKIEQAHLGFVPNAGLCDLILETPTQQLS